MDDENLTMAAGNNAYKIKPAASFHMLPVSSKNKKPNNYKNQTIMKKVLKVKLRTQTFLLFALITFGCNNSSMNCKVDLKLNGQYEINFFNAQKIPVNLLKADFSKTQLIDLQNEHVENKIVMINNRVDDLSVMAINFSSSKSDTIKRLLHIKSTIMLDSISFNGVHRFFKNDGINHSVKGHTDHEITEIRNSKDTLKYFASTTFDIKFMGTINGKSNDLLVDYLIEKNFLTDYTQVIFNAIKDKK